MQRNSFVIAVALILISGLAQAEDTKSEKTLIKYPQPIGKLLSAKRTSTIVSLRENVSESQHNEMPRLENTPVVVPPEISTLVQMNNSDVNRIVCPVDIKDVVFLREKSISVKVTGKDAFVNFKFVKKGDKTLFATEPSEMYVVCGQDTYNLVVVPRSNVPPQTVHLSSGIDKKIKSNNELLGGLPFEKKIMRVVKDVYTEQLADSYSVMKINKQVGNWQEISIIHKRNVDIEGEGLRVKEFEAVLKQGQVPFKLSEKIFTKKEFADNPVAISLEKHVLRPGESIRIFIVESRHEELPRSLYRNNNTTELDPLNDGLALKALEGYSEQEEKKPSDNTNKGGEAAE